MLTRNLSVITLIVSLAACSGGTTSQSGTGPAGIQGASQPPTWTPPSPATPTTPVTAPYPDNVTTAELETRLDPFSSPDCKLPCYNGLVPGQGGLQEALNFYKRLGISALDMQPGDYDSAQDGSGHLEATLIRSSDILQTLNTGFDPPRVDLYLDKNVVRYIYVKWETPPAYLTLARVLETMGQPNRLDLGLVFAEGKTTFVLQLVYTASQVGFAFFGESPSDGSQLLACLSNDRLDATMQGVFAPDERPMSGSTYEKYLLPLQETLGLDYSDFAAQAGAGGCLPIPASQWGAWQVLGGN